MVLQLDRDRIRGIVREIGERLEGDWLLVGGALVAVWFEPRRTTEDVDVFGIRRTGANPRHALLELADELGLPVEALNSAADFFVQRVPGWEDQIEVLHRGRVGTVYRPTPTLFLLLKMGRLSDQDLDDCLRLLDAVGTTARAELDRERVRTALDALPATADEALRDRRERLRRALGSACGPFPPP